ncbi:unnamed protein product [Hydatigera taeniaeformis]|uniref:DUF2889 domain-containing protein n=1 Tax=Hydatigena taeniaeformis TaxID=6205 RepID=A0A0R3WXX1_HYDTA|nr:unnamed protein product [Hydatigera taeniaeformis]
MSEEGTVLVRHCYTTPGVTCNVDFGGHCEVISEYAVVLSATVDDLEHVHESALGGEGVDRCHTLPPTFGWVVKPWYWPHVVSISNANAHGCRDVLLSSTAKCHPTARCAGRSDI